MVNPTNLWVTEYQQDKNFATQELNSEESVLARMNEGATNLDARMSAVTDSLKFSLLDTNQNFKPII